MAAVAFAVVLCVAGGVVAEPAGASRQADRVLPRDPFDSAAMRRFLGGRSGNITAAVYDVASRRTFLLRPGVREYTASIAKVEILAALLARTQREGGLSTAQRQLAAAMIEESDNDAAQLLFEEVGGLPTLDALDARLRMTQTTQNWSWGLIETTPRDQLRLLRAIVLRKRFLSRASRRYALDLLEHVDPAQAWGVSSGPGAGVTVALKNGWDPTAGIWQVNSIGMIRGHGRRYLLAVMTSQPGYAYGVQTIEGISQIVWHELRRRRRVPLATVG